MATLQFKSTNKLGFYSKPWWLNPEWQEFLIGTCVGQWRSTDQSYEILSIINSTPGNGHVKDVFEWFESSCVRDGKSLRVLEIWNEKFKARLVRDGFVPDGGDNLIKVFNK